MEDEYCDQSPSLSHHPPPFHQQAGLEHSLSSSFDTSLSINEEEQDNDDDRPLDPSTQSKIIADSLAEHEAQQKAMQEQISHIFNEHNYTPVSISSSLLKQINSKISSFERITTRLLKATIKLKETLSQASSSFLQASAPWGPPEIKCIATGEETPPQQTETETGEKKEGRQVQISPFENMLISSDSMVSEHCEKNEAFCHNTLIMLNIMTKLQQAYEEADEKLRPQFHTGVIHVDNRENQTPSTFKPSPIIPTLHRSPPDKATKGQPLPAPPYPDQRILTNTTVIESLDSEILRTKIDWASYDLQLSDIPGFIDPFDLSLFEPLDTAAFMKEVQEHRALLGEQEEEDDQSSSFDLEGVSRVKRGSEDECADPTRIPMDEEEKEEADIESNRFLVKLNKEEYSHMPGSSATEEITDNRERIPKDHSLTQCTSPSQSSSSSSSSY